MVNGAPREVLKGVPREYIEGPPRGFLKANPKPHPRPDPRQQTPRGGRPRGFLALGLAEDAAEGLPEENPEGGLQYTLEGLH